MQSIKRGENLRLMMSFLMEVVNKNEHYCFFGMMFEEALHVFHDGVLDVSAS